MPSQNFPSPKFLPLTPGGEHIRCLPADPEELVERMPDISEVKEAYDVSKPTPPMSELASHLRRLSRGSRTPKGGLCYNHACCDISDAWNLVGRGGKAHVLSGVSANGRTLVLLFAPLDFDDYVVEYACKS